MNRVLELNERVQQTLARVALFGILGFALGSAQ